MALTLKELVDSNHHLRRANLSIVRLVSIGEYTSELKAVPEAPINPRTNKPYGKGTIRNDAWAYLADKIALENRHSNILNTKVVVTGGPGYKGTASIVYHRQCLQQMIDEAIRTKGKPVITEPLYLSDRLGLVAILEATVMSFLNPHHRDDIICKIDNDCKPVRGKIKIRIFTKNDFSYAYTAPGAGAVVEIKVTAKKE